MRLRDGRLWMLETAQQEFELVPKAPRHFVSRLGVLEFIFDEGEQPQSLRVVNGNQDLIFKRQ